VHSDGNRQRQSIAPTIVEAILDGRQGLEVTLARLLKGFPVGWEGQYQGTNPRSQE